MALIPQVVQRLQGNPPNFSSPNRSWLISCQTNAVPLPANGSVSGVHYQAITNNADVVFYTVTGGGHTWPGGKPMAEFITGKTTRDINATRLMWNFFVEHSLAR